MIIRDISPSGSENATTPIKSSPTRGVLDGRASELRKKIRRDEAKAKRRGNRSGVTYSPLEQMVVKKDKEANSVIVMRRPVKIQDMD